MIKSKKQMFIVIGVFTLVMLLGTVTYAFFNYTRVGQANTIRTGRISFNTGETNIISLTNVFPISSTDAASDNVNSSEVTIIVTGDTTYNKGVEYLVTVENVTNLLGDKKIPISVAVTPEKTGDLGEVATDYWTQRGGTTSYYSSLSSNLITRNSQRILVGYIAPGQTGINGTIGIRAYLDKDRIAISDTYPEGKHYEVNNNLTQEQVDECVSYLSGIDATEAFCRGTGTITRYGTNYTILEAIDKSWVINNTQKEHLISEGLIKESYTDGTTSTWVNRRMVLTTTEWNSLQSTPLSFKLKVEANEDIWVESGKFESTNITVNSKPYGEYDIVATSEDIKVELKLHVDTETGLLKLLYDGITVSRYNSSTNSYDDITNNWEYNTISLTLLPEKFDNKISEPVVLEFTYFENKIGIPYYDIIRGNDSYSQLQAITS